MDWLRIIASRIGGLFGRRSSEKELSEEVREHLDLLAEENLRRGMSPEEARFAALRGFGGVEQTKELYRDRRGLPWLDTLFQDIRFGLRMLRKAPGFTAVAVLTLALGIGANTAIFSVVDAVLLRPLAFHDPDRLIRLDEVNSQFNSMSVSYPDYLDWRAQNESFQELAAWRIGGYSVTGSGESFYARGRRISANFFSVLGIQPVLGRTFLPEEDKASGVPVVLLSAELWKTRFGSDPGILRKNLALAGKDHTIVGVIPPGVELSGQTELYVPLGQDVPGMLQNRKSHPGIRALGRLRPGVTLEQARGDMQKIALHLAQAYPASNTGFGVDLLPLKEALVRQSRLMLLVLSTAVGFVLLIACANVANLLLARASARKREFAVRAALGAARFRVIRQLLTESALLSLTGAALGLLFGSWGTRLLLAQIPETLPRIEKVVLDARVLLFTLAVALVTGILFGLAPALQGSRTDLQRALKEGGRGSSGAQHRSQKIFVVAQMALTLILLVGTGLMIRSLVLIWEVNPGFDPRNAITLQVSIPPAIANSKDGLRIKAFWEQLVDRLNATPGVRAATVLWTALPIAGDDNETPFWVEGQPKPPSQDKMPQAMFYVTDSGYLDAMGIPLHRGRFFTRQDTGKTPRVVVIDEVLAKSVFSGQDPIGKSLHIEDLGPAEIVGIVGHVKHWGLDVDENTTVQFQIYTASSQGSDSSAVSFGKSNLLVVRTATSPMGLLGDIRRQMYGLDANQTIYNMITMEQIINRSLAARRFSMLLLGVFGALALLLSSVGIYGVVSYFVSQRTHEIGIRMALGAQAGDVLRLVAGEGARLVLFGIAIGVAGALILTRFLFNLIYGVKPTDPFTFVSVAVFLTGVAFVACYVPARRAMKVDPLAALRHE